MCENRENSASATYEFAFCGLSQLNKAIYSPIFSSGSDQHLWQLWIQPVRIFFYHFKFGLVLSSNLMKGGYS